MNYSQIIKPLIFKVSGKDAARYLHSRLSNDIKGLSVGRGCLAAALNPQGRTEGFFSVLHQSDTEYLLCSEGGAHDEVLNAFKRYIVADRVSVEVLPNDTSLVHIIPDADFSSLQNILKNLGLDSPLPVRQEKGFVFSTSSQCTLFPRFRSTTLGFDMIVPSTAGPSFTKLTSQFGITEISPQAFQLLRFKAGIPQFPDELNADSIFSEAAVLEAISYSKGCYVGQEVMERLDSHGKLPKIIRPLKIASIVSDLHKGESITDSSTPAINLGKVLSVVVDVDENATYLFAELKSSVLQESNGLLCRGVQAVLSPLL